MAYRFVVYGQLVASADAAAVVVVILAKADEKAEPFDRFGSPTNWGPRWARLLPKLFGYHAVSLSLSLTVSLYHSFFLSLAACAVWHCCHLIRLSNFVHRWTRCQNLQCAWFKSPDFLQLSAMTTTTTRNSKRIRPYKLPKLLIPIRLLRFLLLCISLRRRSTRSSPTSISNRSHTDFRIILWTSAYIMRVCWWVYVCVYVSGWMSQVCTQNGGRKRHFVQLPRWPCAPDAPPLELGETLSSSVLNVAWSPGSAATWSCLSPRFDLGSMGFALYTFVALSIVVVVVLLKFSLFLFCSLSSSFSCCLQVAPSLATWPAFVSLSAASLNCFPSPSTSRYSCLLWFVFVLLFFKFLIRLCLIGYFHRQFFSYYCWFAVWFNLAFFKPSKLINYLFDIA